MTNFIAGWYQVDLVLIFNDGREVAKSYAVKAPNIMQAESLWVSEVIAQNAFTQSYDTNPLRADTLSFYERKLIEQGAKLFRRFND